MEKRVLQLITSHGTLVTPEAVKYILSKPEPEQYVREILNKFSELPLFLTLDQLKAAEADTATDTLIKEEDKPKEEAPIEVKDTNMIPRTGSILKVPEPRDTTSASSKPVQPPEPAQKPPEPEKPIQIKTILSSKKPIASEYDGNVQILKDVTGQSTSEGSINDFTKYFKTRFDTLRKILSQQRREVTGAMEIAKIRNHQGPIKFIGLVNEVHETKNGHKIIELEDDTDSISAMIVNSSPLINMTFVPDEIVCMIGKLGKTDLVYVDDVIRPDVPIVKRPNKSQVPVNCLFMADIHIGSNTFLHDEWNRFMKWLNGKYSLDGYDELRDQLKYIVVAGDVVDGIGIYPNQEKELDITDIYAQYEDLANKFQELPEHIQVIMQPGNHDAVRPAEPQPTFPKEITKLFNNDIIYVGNPCYFSIETVEVLAYHGCGMDDFVMKIPDATYNKPIQIMKEMLVRRHLAPIYGQRTAIAPEHQDYLMIDKVPDIFVTGHIHKTAFENYRDISLINASAWQAQTEYQKMRNFYPDPGKIILADLQTRKVNILNFA